MPPRPPARVADARAPAPPARVRREAPGALGAAARPLLFARDADASMLLPNRVLLADDDAEVRLGVEDLLSPLGLQFLHAESGPEALEIACRRLSSLALMVLDLHMPGCSGLEVLSRLRVQVGELRVPCIFYSGEATEAIERQARDAGAWAFLRKPVQPGLLRGEVQRALDWMHGLEPLDPPPLDPLP